MLPHQHGGDEDEGLGLQRCQRNQAGAGTYAAQSCDKRRRSSEHHIRTCRAEGSSAAQLPRVKGRPTGGVLLLFEPSPSLVHIPAS